MFCRWRLDLLICLLLAVLTFSTYAQVRFFSFVNYDDPCYITQNPNVEEGLSSESLSWSFTTNHCANWNPLTWISYLFDIQLFGINSGMLHLTNVFLHIANATILFIALRIMTGKLWQCAYIAALFALHPLHVESVAWISERKDVLSTFFWMMTMLSYAWYVRRPYYQEGASIFRYVLVLLCFLLGLMSKPMLVTLPFVLLLLDYWPLNRFQEQFSGDVGKAHKFSIIRALIWEKVPLFILAITISVATFIIQKDWKAVASINDLPIYVRFSNALISYTTYLVKMIWPFALAVIYPHPGKVLGWQFAGSLLTVACVSLMAFKAARQAPFFIVGWLWYIGTLIPVIGIVQVGAQALADRYTYIPLIGVFIIIAWGVPALVPNRRFYRSIISLCAVVIIALFTSTTWLQIKTWANSETLFEHAIETTPNNFLAHNYLADSLEKKGDLQAALHHYAEALRIKPDYELFNKNTGGALVADGKLHEAMEYFSSMLQKNPNSKNAHNGLGLILFRQGKVSEAISHYSEALKIDPLYANAHNNMGLAFFKIGKNKKAIHHFREAIKIRPGFVEANDNLRVALELKQLIN